MQSSLYRERRKYIPPAPACQEDLDVLSPWFLSGEESLVIGDIIHSDGLRVLVLSSNECLEILSRAETIHGKFFFLYIFSVISIFFKMKCP